MVPDPQTLPEAATWHYAVALALLALIGALGHVLRAVVNIVPDRLTNRPVPDLILSSGYDWKDWLFAIQYDDEGYYRLDSLHNLRIAIGWAVFSGFWLLLFAPDASKIASYCIDQSLAALVDLFWYRVESFEW
jgi:hypothetical protein